MAQQTINAGTTANDGTGDPLRALAQKANANFSDLYDRTAPSTESATGVVQLATKEQTEQGIGADVVPVAGDLPLKRRATGTYAIERPTTVTGEGSFCGPGIGAMIGDNSVMFGGTAGEPNIVYGDDAAVLFGRGNFVTAGGDFGAASGVQAIADGKTKRAYSAGGWGAQGGARLQEIKMLLRALTPSNTFPTSLTPPPLFGDPELGPSFTFPSNVYMFLTLHVTGASAAGETCQFLRKLIIQPINDAGIVPSSLSTVGTDFKSDGAFAFATSASSNEISLRVTGLADDPVIWACAIEGIEIGKQGFGGEGEGEEEE